MIKDILAFKFKIDNIEIALPLEMVERVIAAQAVNPIDGSSDILIGVFNLKGTPIPLISLKKRFGKDDIPLNPEQFFIILNTTDMQIALLADVICGTSHIMQDTSLSLDNLVPGLSRVSYTNQENGVIYIYDIKNFLLESEKSQIKIMLDNVRRR